jgi:Zn finger protein HypA/HybF involved in hydrogenase expression
MRVKIKCYRCGYESIMGYFEWIEEAGRLCPKCLSIHVDVEEAR